MITALPWRAEVIPYNGMDDPCIISDVAKDQYGNNQYVAQTVYDMQSMTTRDEVDADTLFIVEACNSHQALLRVARAAKAYKEYPPNWKPGMVQERIAIWKEYSEALKEVEHLL